jgi:maltose operon periplasmic protein
VLHLGGMSCRCRLIMSALAIGRRSSVTLPIHISRLGPWTSPIVAVLMLNACASVNSADDGGTRVYSVSNEVATTFSSAKSCCASMAEFKYATLPLPASVVTHIENSSPAFAFATGKSYFLAYQLPTSPEGLKLTIKSYPAGNIFFPNFLLLDATFKPTRQIGAPDTHFVEPSTWERGHYELEATVLPDDAARYLVILTTDADMAGRHEVADSHILMPAGRIYVPVSTGPYAHEHGPTGKTKLVVRPLAQ